MILRLYHSWRNSYLGIPNAVWLLSFVNLINRCGGLVIGFIALYMTQKLEFGIAQAGYAMSCFGVGTLLGAYSGGRLTDKFGYFKVMSGTLAANGLMLLLILLVQHFYAVCVAVFVLGLVSEAFRPANSVSIVRNSTKETYTRSISLFRMSANIGWAIAPVLGGLLTALGWHWLFWVDGLTCLAATGLLLWYRPRLNTEIPSAQSADVEDNLADGPRRSPLSDRPFLWFLLLTWLNATVFMQMLWTVPVFFKEAYHWNEQKIGVMVALNGLIVFLVEMPLIFRIEKKRPPLYMVTIGLVLYALAYTSFLLPWASVIAAGFYMLFISFGEIFVMPFSSNFTMLRSGKLNQGQYMAYYIMTYSVANTIAPLLGTQIIAKFGFAALWGLMTVFALVSWTGFRMLNRVMN